MPRSAAKLRKRLVIHRGELNITLLGRIRRVAHFHVDITRDRARRTPRYAFVQAKVGLRAGRNPKLAHTFLHLGALLQRIKFAMRRGRDHLVIGHVRIRATYGTLDGDRAIYARMIVSFRSQTRGQIVDGESILFGQSGSQIQCIGELGWQVLYFGDKIFVMLNLYFN